MKKRELPIYLIDSNVILDVLLDRDDAHTEWSIATLIHCSERGNLAVNQIIYAEVAYAFPELQELEKSLQDYQKIPLPWEAAFIASKAYASYKRNGGQRHALMPDFYIGAHALFERLTLVTRDRGYVNYFSHLQCLTPGAK